MIEHVIRQERRGGFWLIRNQGRVLELGNAVYRYVSRLSEKNGEIDEEERRIFEERIRNNGEQVTLDTLQDQGLLNPGAWNNVRHVPLDVPPASLPDDAVVAPKRIYFETTRKCNLACRSCFNNSRYSLAGELSLEEILDVNRQAWELGVFEIRYTGGECTMVSGFLDVVADARRRGFYISIGTNGVYTDEQLGRLVDSGIDWFIVSLDGDREVNDHVRGKGSFDAVLHTLEVLAQHPPIRVRLNMVVARHNLKTIESVARIAATHGVESLNLIPLRPYGRSVRRMAGDMFDQTEFYDFIREVNRLRRNFPEVIFSTTIDLLDPEATPSHDLIVQKKTTCAAGVEACVVGPQGHVYGCSYSPASFPDSGDEEGEKLFIAGNFREDDLKTIWRDSRRWSVFRDLQGFKNSQCHTCSHYTVRCSGSCQIMAWYRLREQQEFGQQDPENISNVCDPYCFAGIFDGRPDDTILEHVLDTA
uniref:Radical SAM additional 4Fe4S-binding SPASM domain-containing protein n=1 Tax=Candidatus Kentrum sp. MB TaxID=2138164 RepID=A0A450XS37_9GAMM|nr:MAG: radical SAM additional 4Fe4S-binding SPASM domain-containing protein [Candidatus Kentron sp. MB]